MKYFLVFALALAGYQGCAAARRKILKGISCQPPQDAKTLLEDVQNMAKSIGEQVHSQDAALQELNSSLNKTLVEILYGFIYRNDPDFGAREMDVSGGIRNIRDNFTATIDQLHEDAATGSKNKVDFDVAYKNTIDQIDQFYKNIDRRLKRAWQHVNKSIQDLLEDLVVVGRKAQTRIKDHKEHNKGNGTLAV